MKPKRPKEPRLIELEFCCIVKHIYKYRHSVKYLKAIATFLQSYADFEVDVIMRWADRFTTDPTYTPYIGELFTRTYLESTLPVRFIFYVCAMSGTRATQLIRNYQEDPYVVAPKVPAEERKQLQKFCEAYMAVKEIWYGYRNVH